MEIRKIPQDIEIQETSETESKDSTSTSTDLKSGISGMPSVLEQGVIPDSISALFSGNQTPALNEFPDQPQNLDPNVHLDEKIDVPTNFPGGSAIDRGLPSLDFGGVKGKTGPDHMGVDLTAGGMKAPADVIAEVLNAGKPTVNTGEKSVEGGDVKANSMSKERAGSQSTPPPGVELSFRARNSSLVSGTGDTTADDLQATFLGKGTSPKDVSTAKDIEARKEKLAPGDGSNKDFEAWKKRTAPDGGTKLTDPDAGGNDSVGPSTGEIAGVVAVRGGATDFVEGFGGGPAIEGDKPPLRYRDLVTDGGDTSETTNLTDTSGAKLVPGGGYTDGPRNDLDPGGTLPPDSGADPGQGNPS